MGFVFQQLGGQQKRLELADYDAPFGRPRRDPVVRDGIDVRRSKNYYPGNSTEPTIHIFGTKLADWELNGRFRDRSPKGGPGHAIAKTAEVKAFVAGQQRVRITWDDLVSVVGLITKFDPGREGAGEVEWKMTIDVYSDDFADVTPTAPRTPDVQDYLSQILSFLQKIPPPRKVPSLNGGLLDSIDDAVSTVTGAVGAVTNLANDVKNFQKSTLGELNRISAVTTQVSTAMSTLRDVFSTTGPDAALTYQRADSTVQLLAAQTSVEEQVRAALSTCSQVQRAVAIAIAGKHKSSYVVKSGDSWESIASRFYSDPGRAVDLQVANNQIGTAPVPGMTIRLPV